MERSGKDNLHIAGFNELQGLRWGKMAENTDQRVDSASWGHSECNESKHAREEWTEEDNHVIRKYT